MLKRLVCHNELVDPKKEREGEEVSFQRLLKQKGSLKAASELESKQRACKLKV